MPTVVISGNTGADFSGCEDSRIVANDAANEFGLEGVIACYDYGGTDHASSLIKFSGLSNIVGAGRTVTGVTLRLYNETALGAATLGLYPCSRAWVESEVTWNEYTAGNSWATPGAQGSGDSEATASTSLAVSATTGYIEFIDSGLIADVQAVVDGGANNGWVINTTAPGFNGGQIITSVQGADTQRPELVVTYTEGAAVDDADPVPAAGVATTSAAGSSTSAATASAASGASTVSAVGGSVAAASAIAAAGVASVSAVASSTSSGAASAVPAAGVATVSAQGGSLAATAATTAQGAATASAFGAAITAASASAAAGAASVSAGAAAISSAQVVAAQGAALVSGVGGAISAASALPAQGIAFVSATSNGEALGPTARRIVIAAQDRTVLVAGQARNIDITAASRTVSVAAA